MFVLETKFYEILFFFFFSANSGRWGKDLLLFFFPFSFIWHVGASFSDRVQWGKGTWGNNQGDCINRDKVFRNGSLGHQTDGNRCKSFYFLKVIFKQTSYTLRYTLIIFFLNLTYFQIVLWFSLPHSFSGLLSKFRKSEQWYWPLDWKLYESRNDIFLSVLNSFLDPQHLA